MLDTLSNELLFNFKHRVCILLNFSCGINFKLNVQLSCVCFYAGLILMVIHYLQVGPGWPSASQLSLLWRLADAI